MVTEAIRNAFRRFFELEAASGIFLLATTVAAIFAANSPLASVYQFVLHLPIKVGLGEWALEKSLHHWINDGLMVIFFFLVGLEIKREILFGHLSSRSNLFLPLFGAVGGMIVPALIFWAFDSGDPLAMRGWAIPTATDIAFALGILALAGSRVPTGLKVFLTALAIIDDLGAVIIIAFFYSSNLQFVMLGGAAIVVAVLYAMNRLRMPYMAPFLLLGVFLWLFVLKSGVHATIAGVLLALTIPAHPLAPPTRGRAAPSLEGSERMGNESMLSILEHRIHPWVAFGIMPIFAFFNAGLDLSGLSWSALTEPVTMGIALGLFLGKQLGVFFATGAAIVTGFGTRPGEATWVQLYGVSILAGIGFTMSLFVGSLAYADAPHLLTVTQLGVITGSLLSSIVGLTVLMVAGSKPPKSG